MEEDQLNEPKGAEDTRDPLDKVGKALRESFLSAVKASGEAEAKILALAAKTAEDTIKTTGTLAAEAVTVAGRVASETIQTAEKVGLEFFSSTKNMVKGALGNLDDVGDALSTTGKKAKAFAEEASQVGAELAGTAKRTVAEAVETVRSATGITEDSARDSISAAFETVGRIGETTAHAVKGLVAGAMEGVRDIAQAVKPPSKEGERCEDPKTSNTSPADGGRPEGPAQGE